MLNCQAFMHKLHKCFCRLKSPRGAYGLAEMERVGKEILPHSFVMPLFYGSSCQELKLSVFNGLDKCHILLCISDFIKCDGSGYAVNGYAL